MPLLAWTTTCASLPKETGHLPLANAKGHYQLYKKDHVFLSFFFCCSLIFFFFILSNICRCWHLYQASTKDVSSLFSNGIIHILKKFAPRLEEKGSRPGGSANSLGNNEHSTKALHFLSFSFLFFPFLSFSFLCLSFSFIVFHFLSLSFIVFHCLSLSFVFFLFVGCSRSDFLEASISLRFLLTALM